MKHSVQDRGTLLLALIAGLSINGTFAALFSSIVPFSIFPILSLVLTVYCLHQRYQNRSMPVGLPGLAAACFILGVLVSPGNSVVAGFSHPTLLLRQQHAAFHMMGIRELVEQRQARDLVGLTERFQVLA